MSKDIWAECEGKNHISTLKETAWRLVEAQEITATRRLVDSLEEQIILEDIIENAKPPLSKRYLEYHPLLHTPFRYPPLKYGSRFGSPLEHSLWYGSTQPATTMAEKAYYQFHFLRASSADFGMVELRLTLFSANVKTEKGVSLLKKPFAEHKQTISSPDSYHRSQLLGAAMREDGVEAFTYQSARDPNDGVNIALFTPKAFMHKSPTANSFQSWQCIANKELIEFIRICAIELESLSFNINTFLVNGKLPYPAN